MEPITGFPRRACTSSHYSIVPSGELVQQKADDGKFRHELMIGPAPDENQLRNEIDELIESRSGVLNESIIQENGLLDYFRGVLSFSRYSHRHPYALAHIAVRIASLVAIQQTIANALDSP